MKSGTAFAFLLFTLLVSACTAAVEQPEAGGPIAIVASNVAGQVGPQLAVEPGGELQLSLSQEVCCVFWEELSGPVTWSISPRTGASISPGGLVRVDAKAPVGAEFVVSAVRIGERFENRITVFSPQSNPLAGEWEEIAQFACEGPDTFPPGIPIRELIFFADGAFRVTWQPFEAYVDYTGTYTYHAADGRLRLQPRTVNYLPGDIDAEGWFAINEEGNLELWMLWLGSPQGAAMGTNCGHIFSRQ